MALRRPVVGAGVALTAFALAACGSPADPAPAATGAPADETISIVASTNVYGSIAAAVGGDGVEVQSLIDDPAADPHSYESTPADAAAVAESDLVIFNGGGYDGFVPDILEAAGGERIVINVSDISGLVPTDAADDDHADDDHAGEEHADEEHGDDGHGHGDEDGDDGHGHGHEHGAFNEHVWYSLPTVQTLATQLATDLSAADPDGAAQYTANAEAFNAQVDELIERAEGIGVSAPGGRVAVTEPVPGYLIETAGLIDVTPPQFSQSVEEDTDPPAAVVAETLALFTPGGEPLRALILNDQTQTPTTDQVRQAAEAGGVPVVEMSETLPEGQTDFVAWMSTQIEALSSALNPV